MSPESDAWLDDNWQLAMKAPSVLALRERTLEEKIDLLISKVATLEVLVAKLREESA